MALSTGRKLTTAMAMYDKSRQDVAKVLQVSSQTISNWMDDKTPIPHDKVLQLCETLGMTVAQFDEIGG